MLVRASEEKRRRRQLRGAGAALCFGSKQSQGEAVRLASKQCDNLLWGRGYWGGGGLEWLIVKRASAQEHQDLCFSSTFLSHADDAV